MALTKLFNFIGLSALLCMPLTSCDSSSEPHGPISFEAVGLLSVEASVNFDLSDRSNWKMYVGKFPYSFEVSGTQLSAIPANGNEYVFEFTETNRRAVITLVAPNYDGSRSEQQVPNFKDQSTPDKFMRCDLLKAEYQGTPTAALKEINLFHQNALLAFRTIDLPEEARVFIVQTTFNQTITPLRDSEDPTLYKAIVLPQMEMSKIYILIDLNGKRYERSLPESAMTRENMPSRPQGIGASALVEFDVRINESDRLVIENCKRTAYTKEWPIDR